MAYDIISVAFVLVVLLVFYIIMSFSIREAIELTLKCENNTFLCSSEIALAMCLFLLLQLFLGQLAWTGILLLVCMAAVIFVMIRNIYCLDLRRTCILFLIVVGIAIFIFLLAALILYMFQ